MSYSPHAGPHLIPDTGSVLDADDLSSAAVHGDWICVRPCVLTKIGMVVTTVTVGACTFEVNYRPTAGSATGEVQQDTVTVPGATAAGEAIYSTLATPKALLPGESIAFEITSAATSGNGNYYFEVEDDPETEANNSNSTASA